MVVLPLHRLARASVRVRVERAGTLLQGAVLDEVFRLLVSLASLALAGNSFPIGVGHLRVTFVHDVADQPRADVLLQEAPVAHRVQRGELAYAHQCVAPSRPRLERIAVDLRENLLRLRGLDVLHALLEVVLVLHPLVLRLLLLTLGLLDSSFQLVELLLHLLHRDVLLLLRVVHGLARLARARARRSRRLYFDRLGAVCGRCIRRFPLDLDAYLRILLLDRDC